MGRAEGRNTDACPDRAEGPNEGKRDRRVVESVYQHPVRIGVD